MVNLKLWAFLLSCLLAFLAGHMVNYSIIFIALERFDSHALAGIGYGLCFGPPIILGWIAGVYCDRYSPRKVILLMQNSYFISLVLLFSSFAVTEFWQQPLLLLAALMSGIGWSFVAPARFATLPFYVSNAKLPGATIGLNLMVMTGFGLAPMLLKLIKVDLGWNGVFIGAALLFIVSIALLLPLRFNFVGKPAEKALSEIKSSLVYIKSSRPILQLLVLASIAYLLMGPMQVLLPSVAQHTLGLDETAQGQYLSLVAFSLIVGGLLAMILKNSGKIGWQMMLSTAVAAIGIGYLGAEQQLTVSVTILVISAIGGGIAISFIVAGLQRFSPAEHRGRIMSVYTIVGQFIPAASGVFAGLLAQLFSLQLALQIAGGFILILTLVATVMLKTIRQLETYQNEQ